MTETTCNSRAQLDAYEPSNSRYSTRLPKAKYLQRLLLETARALAPALQSSDDQAEAAASIEIGGEAAIIALHGPAVRDIRTALGKAGCARLALLSSTLSRQLVRLTGCGDFELKTWSHSQLTQPVQLRLRTEAGGFLEIFNPRATANRHFHGLRELSQCLAEAFGPVERSAGDLDRLVASGSIPGWHAIPAGSISEYHGAYAPHTPVSTPHPLSLTMSSLRAARAQLGASIPKVIIDVEDFEVDLERSIVHRYSRWGQDEHMAPERTKRRQQALGSAATADLIPLSRSLKQTAPDELVSLANDQPLTHLAIEFGVSEAALRKRLKKAGWVSPRGWKKRR